MPLFLLILKRTGILEATQMINTPKYIIITTLFYSYVVAMLTNCLSDPYSCIKFQQA